jgi:hypothetical protein
MPVTTDLKTLTIANGATTSDTFVGNLMAAYALQMPAAMTGASIGFSVSADGTTFGTLRHVLMNRPRDIAVIIVFTASMAVPPDALTAWKAGAS